MASRMQTAVFFLLAHGASNFAAGALFSTPPVPASEDTGPAAVSVRANGPVPFLILSVLLCLSAFIVVLLQGQNLSYSHTNAG